MKRKIIFCLGWLCLATGCANDNEEDLYPETVTCDTSAVTYSGTVKAVLQRGGCTGCHATTGPSGGIILDSYAGVKNHADTGRLLGAITHAPGYIPMPLGGTKLADCDIAGIKKWIENGTPDN